MTINLWQQLPSNVLASIDRYLDDPSSLSLASTCKTIKNRMNQAFYNRYLSYLPNSSSSYQNNIDWKQKFIELKTGKNFYEMTRDGHYQQFSLPSNKSGKISFTNEGFFASSIFSYPPQHVRTYENTICQGWAHGIHTIERMSIDYLQTEKIHLYNQEKKSTEIEAFNLFSNRYLIKIIKIDKENADETILITEVFETFDRNKKIAELHESLQPVNSDSLTSFMFFSTCRTPDNSKEFFIIKPTDENKLCLYDRNEVIDLKNSDPISEIDINGYSILDSFNQEVFLYSYNLSGNYVKPEVKIVNPIKNSEKDILCLNDFVNENKNCFYFGLPKMVCEDSFILGCTTNRINKTRIVKYNSHTKQEISWDLEKIINPEMVNDFSSIGNCLILSCADKSIILFYSKSKKIKINIDYFPISIFTSYDRIIFHTVDQKIILLELDGKSLNENHKVVDLPDVKPSCIIF